MLKMNLFHLHFQLFLLAYLTLSVKLELLLGACLSWSRSGLGRTWSLVSTWNPSRSATFFIWLKHENPWVLTWAFNGDQCALRRASNASRNLASSSWIWPLYQLARSGLFCKIGRDFLWFIASKPLIYSLSVQWIQVHLEEIFHLIPYSWIDTT